MLGEVSGKLSPYFTPINGLCRLSVSALPTYLQIEHLGRGSCYALTTAPTFFSFSFNS